MGKSVITANLAAALSSSGQRVLVLDADLRLANLLLGSTPTPSSWIPAFSRQAFQRDARQQTEETSGQAR